MSAPGNPEGGGTQHESHTAVGYASELSQMSIFVHSLLAVIVLSLSVMLELDCISVIIVACLVAQVAEINIGSDTEPPSSDEGGTVRRNPRNFTAEAR